MKKIFLIASSAFAAMSMNAEMVVQVKPFAVANDATEVYADIEIVNTDHAVANVGFDLYLPAGARVYTNSSGKLVSSSFALVNDRAVYTAYDPEEEDDVNYNAMQTNNKNFQTDSNGVEFLRAGATGNCNIKGTSGTVFRVRIKFDGTLADGVYPIQIKNTKLIRAGADMQTTVVPDATSYFVVGNPTNAEVTMSGVLPSFVNTALVDQEGIKTLDLTKVTAVNGDFAYVAGRDVVAPAGVTANVKYVAPLAGTYSSFCAPVDVTTPCYTFTSCDGTTAVFTPADVAPAGEPVLINEAVNSTAASATLESVAAQNITSGYYVANDGSGMRSVKTSATIPALRGSWDIAASSNLRIAIETPTGIQVIGTADEVFGNTYDLKGRQTTNAKNGVFVVNGKKQFVK